MIPQTPDGKEWTETPIVSSFLPPYDEKYNPYEQNVMGGTDLNDGEAGRLVKQWTIKYDRRTSTMYLGPRGLSPVWSRYEPGVVTISLAFDNNMSPVICWLKMDGAYIYYQNQNRQYVTDFYPGVTGVRVFVDDARNIYNTDSDVIIVYTLNNKVYYRRQRDRYAVEHFICNSRRTLKRAGPTIGYRVQIELV